MRTFIVTVSAICLAIFALLTIKAATREYKDPVEIAILVVIDVVFAGLCLVAWLGGGA